MAVFTQVSAADAAAFLDDYDIGALDMLAPIAEGVENTNYRLTVEGGAAYVLTLFEKRVRAEDLPHILALIAHVSDKGYPAPRPVARKDGALLGRLCGRPATIIRWAEGAWLREPSAEDCRKAGAALARLHLLSDDGPEMPANRFGPAAWRDLALVCAQRAGGEDERLLNRVRDVIEALTDIWPDALPAGPIHGDYFPDNVLFKDGDVSGVIDFYFACEDARAYDLAVAINAWGFRSGGVFDEAACAGFCQGYASVRPLSALERASMPMLCAGSAARFTLTRLHDVLYRDETAMVKLKDPAPFAARLDFHRDVRDPGAYGL
ncbi:MAG: homoserine kinase [Maricaulaceae bacterium]|jgi:homoserine kinase type II